MKVVTRFAPSPTGTLHIGSVRTALFSWLFARGQGGKFLLRIEDTDTARSTQDASELILDTLEWLGLNADEPPVYQSQRAELYRRRSQELLDAGFAYYCVCSKERLDRLRREQMKQGIKPRYDLRCRDLNLDPPQGAPSVIRFKNPLQGTVEVNDLVQGKVAYANSELDDLIIVRPDQSPTYNFAVVVDEIDMGVTHVIRGDDHLNNTPRQMNLFKAFGCDIPQFAHVPMILSADGKKISKRDNPPSILEYRDKGYLPQALLNYLVRLGWAHQDQEVFTTDEMVRLFDPERIHRSPASIDTKKMDWINHQHMLSLEPARAACLARPFLTAAGIDQSNAGASVEDVFEVQKTRCKTLLEFAENSRFFFAEFDEYDESAAAKFLDAASVDLLRQVRTRLAGLSQWTQNQIHAELQLVVEENGVKFGQVAQPLRVALTGNTISPGIDETIRLIGQDRVLKRLDRAIVLFGGHQTSD